MRGDLRQRGQPPELLRLDRERAVLLLHAAFHDEAGRADDERTVLLEEVGPDDRLEDAGLVLDGEEDETLRGAGPLADDDGAARLHARAVRLRLELAG